MPKCRKTASARPTAIQLPLFEEAVWLICIRPEHNEWRLYRMEI